MRAALTRSINEIQDDPALRVYGALLCLGHFVTFLYWSQGGVEHMISSDAEAICWPFWEDCWRERFLDTRQVVWLMRAYVVATVATAALFGRRSWTRVAFWALVGVTLLKAFVFAQDFRLRMNQHYMHFFTLAAFLALPAKRDVLRFLIVAFYVAAGALKWNREWLSGAALYGDPWLPRAWWPASCAYVLVLEQGVVWGVLARRGWLFWGAFAQLVAFHVYSWPIVGFFYPVLMFGLIAIFPLARLLPAPGAADPPEGLLASFARGRQRASTYAFVGLFAALQLVPRLYPGDTAITGEGRLWALHMFDALIACRAEAIVRDPRAPGGELRADVRLRPPSRIACDPIVYFNRAHAFCRQFRANPHFQGLGLRLSSRRRTDARFQTVIDLPDFCAASPTYSMLPNDWILTNRFEPTATPEQARACRDECAAIARAGCAAADHCFEACAAEPEAWTACVAAIAGDCTSIAVCGE